MLKSALHSSLIFILYGFSGPVLAADSEDNVLLDVTDTAQHEENNYTHDPQYVFAQYFFKFLETKFHNGEPFDISKDKNLAKFTFHYYQALENADRYAISTQKLTEWYSEINNDPALDPEIKETVKAGINKILDKKNFSDEQMRALLFYFLDTYDANFKALSYDKKISLSFRSLTLRIMSICNQPPSIIEKLGMALHNSKYPVYAGQIACTEVSTCGFSYFVGVMTAIIICAATDTHSIGAIFLYGLIPAVAVPALYNGIQWLRLHKDVKAAQF